MDVIAINSSPLMERGNTALILNPFIEGLKEAGASVETLYPFKMKINPCTGCFSCWVKHPGKCIFSDDMDELLPKIAKADVIVLATPLYVDGMTGTMKNLLDRCIPLGLPFFEVVDDFCRHPIKEGVKENGKLVLVSNCGFWEIGHFDALVNHVKAICKNFRREFAGTLLRPHGPALRAMLERGFPVNDVLEAAKAAGRALVTSGKIPEELQQKVARPLLPRDMYVENTNRLWQECVKAGKFLGY
ncbi:flavoprotein [Thermosulfidibacter takaii ABI70S6]|uniref:Flavoprotein n=1 Tax=Thermosulfidibacter takaii (strain DSM 17441 / JCM 13301 / NBRC 103674 / ABI70S6) TaxID=1298851 RepID=A0A0S3QT60_THET7|nr:flavodoxin family protein [Thermosulfidibacter takaii]BAT71529.1 flavoprotein [Thermosulfidibacter takaii ABI70S6]